MEEILEKFSEQCSSSRLIWVASCHEDVPHLVPVCFVKYPGKKRLLVANIFISRTEEIVKRNPWLALATAFFEDGWDGYLLKGKAEVLSSGREFESFKREVEEKSGGKRSPKSAIAVEVEEVYSLKPGRGKKKLA